MSETNWIGKRRPEGDRPAANPGGCECEVCGCIFIGEEWHTYCVICLERLAKTGVETYE